MDEIKSKININSLIADIESNYDVTNWSHNGYLIWPILRISLYMTVLRRDENRRSSKKKENSNMFLKLKTVIVSFKDYLLINRKKVNVVYTGAPSHCVIYNGLEFNRYFDILMDSDESNSLYFSKAPSKKRVYKPKRHFIFTPFLTVFSIIDKVFGCYSPSTPYIEELNDILQSKGIYVDGLEKVLRGAIRKVDISIAMFHFFLKKIQPNEIWVLCYYSMDMMGMLISADRLSIPTIDMQHGGQGINHLAYSNWKKVPQNGYEALPVYFYTWDEFSANTINEWTKNNKKHSAKVFGNPWVDAWKKNKFQKSDYEWPENIILYTLQPTGEPLEKYILETIRKSKFRWSWWLRLHPRQIGEKEDIIDRLKEFEIYDTVNIEQATQLPLPEILTHTKVHITKFSGCALEAYQFNVPSIIIDSRGVKIYKKYIDVDDKIVADLTQSSQNLLKTIKIAFS